VVDYLDRRGALRIPPFDAAPAELSLEELSRKRVSWFLETSSRERGFPLTPRTTTRSLLTHLNLLGDGKPTNAAVLLFGSVPQRLHRSSDVKCSHSHGPAYQRPFLSYQIFEGDLFALADQALEFVLARINRSVGTRGEGAAAPASYELRRRRERERRR
jgi:ATP-dependent DNA helicase RecG